MRWSATKLRWVMLAGVLLLASIVAGFFGLARYRAGQIWRRILARNGVNLRQETNGFTWSQSSKGRTVFTLHASKATPLGKNKWTLHDAVLILYGREPGRNDRISGKEFQYDEDAGVARAIGEVHMDLQAPEPGGKAPAAGTPESMSFAESDETTTDPHVIHVRTSGLVYVRKLGIAATAETTEFRYGGITCVSRGAEFDSAQSLVRLLADVHMEGSTRDAPFALTAGHAELSRTANTADLVQPVLVSGERSVRAAHALLHLRKDGTLQTADGSGTVELRAGTRNVLAPQATASFGAENAPEHARLFTGVRFVDTDRARPEQGSAGTLDLTWAAGGQLRTTVAQGSVQFDGSSPDPHGVVRQHLTTDQLVAEFAPATGGGNRRPLLQKTHLLGRAEVESTRPGATSADAAVITSVSADDLVTDFGMNAGKLSAKDMVGTGHTRLQQTAEDGSRQQSTGDHLQASFTAGQATGGARTAASVGQTVTSAVQSGHVEIASWTAPKAAAPGQMPQETTGHADRAVYAGQAGTLTLSGRAGEPATVQQPSGDLAAATIVVQQATGDAEASGSVIATSLGSGTADPATHVLASRARLLHQAGLTEFFGESGRPAQLWQGGSQVLAAAITLDQRRHSLAARPAGPGDVVRAVFSTTPAHEPAAGQAKGTTATPSAATGRTAATSPLNNNVPDAARSAVRVSAAAMDYDDSNREAVFRGDVHLAGVLGDLSSDRGVAILQRAPAAGARAGAAGPPQMGGALERMVLLGDVRLSQMGRTGVGEQLTYTAATDSFVLTGTPGSPPRVMGEQGSVVTGTTLLFRNTDSTIVVAGTEGGPKQPGKTRVHTETDLKQRP